MLSSIGMLVDLSLGTGGTRRSKMALFLTEEDGMVSMFGLTASDIPDLQMNLYGAQQYHFHL